MTADSEPRHGATGGVVKTPKDTGEGIHADNAAWSFGDDVPEQFIEHVRRSVPLYDQGHQLVCDISDFFLRDESLCYELGMSTGELVRRMAARHGAKDVRFVGIDIEPAMIAQAQGELGDAHPNVTLVVDDVNHYAYEPCDLIVAYYTVQFVPPRLRQRLIERLYQSLNWGGGLLMFEKVRGADARFQEMMAAIYIDYKLGQGYTPDEIVAKARSLKGILEPFSTEGNLDLLKRAGFVDVMTVMKYVCFEGFLAIK